MRFMTSRGFCLTALCLGLAAQTPFSLAAQTAQQAQPAAQRQAPQQRQAISPETLFSTMLVNAEKGQSQAMLTVALLYEQGIGTPRHFTKALEWYGKAAKAGNSEAQYRLGVCYEIGVGTTADMGKALEAYAKAASMGFAPAQYKLADIYLNGRGEPKDERKGFDFLSKAAQGGELAAMFDMGQVLRNGLFGHKADLEKARQWYAKAADLGHAQSILALADMLRNGQGGKADPQGSLRWYLIGQKAGMSGEALDAVIKDLRGKLSSAQAQEAEKAATAWIADRASAQAGQRK
uniref:tetratricopeptide repeat protein n=1 Tax=Castellaniella defragrans TaxID=75697 RepID=UPI0033402A8E